MDKPTWIIHCITDIAEYIAEYKKDCKYIGNFHTHGLNKYNNQRELCIVLALEKSVAVNLLNTMGLRVANGETVFTEGIRSDILQDDLDVQLITFDNDPDLYVILPDPNGKLPMDDDCQEPYKSQIKYAENISKHKD